MSKRNEDFLCPDCGGTLYPDAHWGCTIFRCLNCCFETAMRDS